MNAHFFFLSGPVAFERLSWIEECLKFYFVHLYPETLVHQKKSESPFFSFFLTGDALYSLEEPETLQVWTIILAFSSVRIVCDRQELDLRGIGIGPLRMRFLDQVIDINSPGADGEPSFWKDLAHAARHTKPALSGTVGWFQQESPYMHRSAWYGLCFLSAALKDRLSTELYARLDGIHLGHQGQCPSDAENIGEVLTGLSEQAMAAGLGFLAIACANSANTRGYSTWDDGHGTVISTCTIRPFKIRELNHVVDRFTLDHTILSPNSGSLNLPKQSNVPTLDRMGRDSKAPPVTLLITRSPYSTELAYQAVAFAVACAHAGILTRVIFIEDGIYAVTGHHRVPMSSALDNLQDLINVVAGSKNLHFFVFTPSLQKRGITKEKSLNAVLDIGYPDLGKILFSPHGNVAAEHQRLLIF